MNYLKNKTALITGVSKGLGLAFAQALSACGVQVIGWGRTAPVEYIPDFHFIHCTLDSLEAVQSAWKKTLKIHPEGIDILINNAGFGHFAPIENMEAEKWLEQININLNLMFYCTHTAVPSMKAKKSGHIVNISSIAGKTGAAWGTAYSAAKFGVAGFSDSLFQELRGFGIKVSVIFPGSTDTNFFDEVPGISRHANMLRPEEIAQTLIHILDTAPNCLISEVVVRPLVSKPPQ